MNRFDDRLWNDVKPILTKELHIVSEKGIALQHLFVFFHFFFFNPIRGDGKLGLADLTL